MLRLNHSINVVSSTACPPRLVQLEVQLQDEQQPPETGTGMIRGLVCARPGALILTFFFLKGYFFLACLTRIAINPLEFTSKTRAGPAGPWQYDSTTWRARNQSRVGAAMAAASEAMSKLSMGIG